MRTASVTFRKQTVEVEFHDLGWEPDTNAHVIEWCFVKPPVPEATQAEEDDVYFQLSMLDYEPILDER